jgi:hypothetical protein
LTVRAERTRQPNDNEPQGSCRRQLLLGDALDPDHIDAHYDGEVLTVSHNRRRRRGRLARLDHRDGGPQGIEVTSTEVSSTHHASTVRSVRLAAGR